MNSILFALVLLPTWQEPSYVDPRPPSEIKLEDSKGQALLYLPRNERLTFRVDVDVAIFEAALGEVVQTCKIEPYATSILTLADPSATAVQGDVTEASSASSPEAVTIAIHAKGEYALYDMDSRLESRHLPQAWPASIYRQVAKGSSTRRRESMIGTLDNVPTSSYRKDTSKGAPSGTRIWREPSFRTIPPDTLDMLSAVFACRTLIREGQEERVFPMVEKDRLWELTLRRGKERRIETGAGTFDAVEILLIPAPWPDEEIDASNQAKFEGLFGMKGSIHIWVEKRTGVTVRIQGDLPAGPLTLGVDVVLESYSGTPADFAPIADPIEDSSEN